MSKRTAESALAYAAPRADRFAAPDLTDEKMLNSFYPIFLFCVMGGRLKSPTFIKHAMPFTFARVNDAWSALVAQSPARVMQLATEALAYVRAQPHLHTSPAQLEALVRGFGAGARAVSAALQEDAILRESNRKKGAPPPPPTQMLRHLVVPAPADVVAAAAAAHVHERPICSMHDLTAEARVRLATAVADELAGTRADAAGWLEHTQAWLHNTVLLDLRHHELCAVAHELAHTMLDLNLPPDRLLSEAPEEMLVDLLVHYGEDLKNRVTDPGVKILLTAYWLRSAKELHAVRPGVTRAIRAVGADLAPYQQAACQWVLERERLPAIPGLRFKGGELVMVPGLGKTRTGLTIAAVREPGQGPTLALVPYAVLDDWVAENQKAFAQSGRPLRLLVAHSDFLEHAMVSDAVFQSAFRTAANDDDDDPMDESEDSADDAQPKKAPPPPPDLVITTVETLVKTRFGQDPSRMAQFGRVIIDEVHTLSSGKKSKRYKDLLRAVALIPRRIGLTGTPYRNARTDIRAQLTLLGMDPRTVDDALLYSLYQVNYGPETRQILPPLTVTKEAPLDELEWDLYRQVYEYGRQMRESGAGFMKLNAVQTRLRQAAISMDMLDVEKVREMAAEVENERVRKKGGVVVAAVTDMFFSALTWTGWAPVAPAKPVARPEAIHNTDYVSSRLRAVMATLREIDARAPTDKILIFSNFSETFEKLGPLVTRDLGWRFGKFTGDADKKERRQMRLDFDQDPAFKLLMLTYGAGGVGMNLQAATHVIEIDPCFNDMTRVQAEARAVRTGQTRVVTIYRFVAPGTYEMRMEEIRAGKADDWANMQGKEPAAGKDAKGKQVAAQKNSKGKKKAAKTESNDLPQSVLDALFATDPDRR